MVARTLLPKWLGPPPVLHTPRAGMLWDGVRLNPNDLATLNAGGCPVTDALLVPASIAGDWLEAGELWSKGWDWILIVAPVWQRKHQVRQVIYCLGSVHFHHPMVPLAHGL